MKRLVPLPILIFLIITALTQFPITFSLLKQIPLQASSFTTDNLGNSYVITKNELIKYTPSGDLQYRYSNLTLGNITSVDATNPLKILLFYRDFSKLLFLDNTLSEKGSPLLLDQVGLNQATLACTSYDNGIWIYDPVHFELQRFDQNFQLSQQVKNINQALGYEIIPDLMTEYDNALYLNNPATGLLVFDRFGTYFKTIPIKSITSFQIIGDQLYYYAGNVFYSFHLKTLEENNIMLPDTAQAVRIEKERLMLLKSDGLAIYSIK